MGIFNQNLSAGRFAAVTPSNTDDLGSADARPFGIYVGGAGDVAAVGVNDPDDSGTVFAACPVGFILPGAVRKILSTGTTATNLVAMYEK